MKNSKLVRLPCLKSHHKKLDHTFPNSMYNLMIVGWLWYSAMEKKRHLGSPWLIAYYWHCNSKVPNSVLSRQHAGGSAIVYGCGVLFNCRMPIDQMFLRHCKLSRDTWQTFTFYWQTFKWKFEFSTWQRFNPHSNWT